MRKISGIILLMLMLFASTAFAEVYTADYVTDGENTVYVTGQENFHPIEYYNSQTGNYEGVMPAVLADISEKTGIDFTYLRRDGKSQSLADADAAADAVVTGGNANEVVILPKLDKAIGMMDYVNKIAGASEDTLREDGTLEVELQVITGATNEMGFGTLSAR